MTAAPGTALVVGASGALGAAIAARLRARGYLLVATHAASSPPPPASGWTWARFDARDGESGEVAVALTACGEPLEVVVYAAGAASSKRELAASPPGELADLFAVNALGLASLWRGVHELARAGRARVLAVGSQAAATCTPGNGPYAASKAALEALALTLAKEEARHGVRVNVLSPSIIASPQAERIIALKGESDAEAYYRKLPWGRALSLEEVADAAASLAADATWSYLSGQVVPLCADIPPEKDRA